MKTTIFWVLVFLVWASDGRAQAPYYEGKTIRIVVGYPAGSAHDQWGRLIAPYLTKFIPGNPNVIVQNMAGAGSMVAANYIWGIAKPDGLSLGIVNAALYFDQLLARKEVQFDWPKFAWIGSSTPTHAMLYMWANTPYKTIHDVRTAAVPPKCGATGTGNTGYYLPKLLEETIGAKFTIVMGYQGGADIDLAAEKGEVHCRAFTTTVFFAREPFHTWRKNGLVRVLVQAGKNREARLSDVPTFTELMDHYQTSDPNRRLATVLLGSGGFGSAPTFSSPGVQEEQLKTLRAAYAKAMNHPDFIAEAKKKGLEPELISGEELQGLAKEVVIQPPEVIARIKKLIGD
jgi:tripartite-type tricarboxylate transporter receptor subunit TctC